ncbi:MAG: hypothetical protein U0790_08595 [Isosphaeraceae bacterium]
MDPSARQANADAEDRRDHGPIPGDSTEGRIARGELKKTVGILTLAALMGITSWVVASLSTWLVPVYVTAMALIFAFPRSQHPRSSPRAQHEGQTLDPTTHGEDGDARRGDETGPVPPTTEKRQGKSKGRRRSPASAPDPHPPAGEDAGGSPPLAGPPATPAKPRRGRNRGRKPARPGPRSELGPPGPTSTKWIRVGPGKFVRADTEEPSPASVVEPQTTPSTAEDVPAATQGPSEPVEMFEPAPPEASTPTPPSTPAAESIESQASTEDPGPSGEPFADPDLVPAQPESAAAEAAGPLRQDDSGMDRGRTTTEVVPTPWADQADAGPDAEEQGIAPSAPHVAAPAVGFRHEPEEASRVDALHMAGPVAQGPHEIPSRRPMAAGESGNPHLVGTRRDSPRPRRTQVGGLRGPRSRSRRSSRVPRRRGQARRPGDHVGRFAAGSMVPVHSRVRQRRCFGRPEHLYGGFHARSPPARDE